MKKLLVMACVAALLVALAVFGGCAGGASGGGAGSKTQIVEVLPDAPTAPNDRGFQMVSDEGHFYFSVGGGTLYQTDTAFESPLKADDIGYEQVYSLCKVGSEVFYGTSKSDDAGGKQLRAYDPAQQTIRVADTFGNFAEKMGLSPYAGGLVYSDYNDLDFLSVDGNAWEISYEDDLGLGDFKSYRAATDGTLVYFTGTDYSTGADGEDILGVYSFDPNNPTGSLTRIADVEEIELAANDSGVYFLAEPQSASDGADASQASAAEADGNSTDKAGSDSEDGKVLELMFADTEGNVESTGVTGVFEPRFFTYGNYVFYTRHDALAGVDGTERDAGSAETENDYDVEEEGPLWRPCAYDAVSGTEYVIDRPEYKGLSVIAVDASGGYLFADIRHTSDHLISNLADASDYRDFWDTIGVPKESQALLDWQADAEAARARAEQEAREAAANEPYGPGSSTLHLEAGEGKSSCFKLVRMDGSVEFQVLLGPGESQDVSFPSGRYTLKIAEGTDWISDDEAFGPSGHYSTTDVYKFAAGSSYEIGSGAAGDFSGDSQSGFTG